MGVATGKMSGLLTKLRAQGLVQEGKLLLTAEGKKVVLAQAQQGEAA